jgi:GrpB-like predicted nucleotidyltransferase (UPF0157 family)
VIKSQLLTLVWGSWASVAPGRSSAGCWQPSHRPACCWPGCEGYVRVVCVEVDTIDSVELIGGVEKREIKLVPADPRWPERFEEERAKIAAALGTKAIRIDHIGSTSIPGIVAKPIIDIDLSVRNVDDDEDYLPALIAAGYQLRVRESGHRMVRTADLGVHVHCCTAGSGWEQRHLLFRDWLRRDEADRVAYGELKKALAQQDWPDMNAYAAAKSALIKEITAPAERWAADSNWAAGSMG